ncbi:hypothetical protein FGRMN_10329 [Fusarium graminum]|nr:hypothetical protein FGRMN_10329 [Fusarium graminum]
MTQGSSHVEEAIADEHTKLIICFDGTGNTFSGTNADTNVVKILRKLNRNHPKQFHYYQTGIGTYDVNETSVNKSFLGEARSKVSKVIDQSFGTTFDAHVIAGYRFLMRYYETDAKIYIFGFSRGAFTAKYLARMVNVVGLLCKGNEEMVPFAYRLYQKSLECESADRVKSQKKSKLFVSQQEHEDEESAAEDDPLLNGHKACADDLLAGQNVVKESKETIAAKKEIRAFGETFCRTSGSSNSNHENIQVFFLGLWDCVNSVAVVENNAPAPMGVTGTAKHIRHAVAVDERRVKFKPALLAQDIRNDKAKKEDIREVWFPGNHGDIGGGWPAVDGSKLTAWQKFKYAIVSFKASNLPGDMVLEDDRLQMSDMALEWMIREVDRVGKNDPRSKVHWCHGMESFKANMDKTEDVEKNIINGFQHDCLSFGRGTAFFKVCMWKFMEMCFFIPRWELNDAIASEKKGWVYYKGLPNFGAARDIPRGAILHDSLRRRLEDVSDYAPTNNHGDRDPSEVKKLKLSEEEDNVPCLRARKGALPKLKTTKPTAFEAKVNAKMEKEESWDERHATWQFDYPASKLQINGH